MVVQREGYYRQKQGVPVVWPLRKRKKVVRRRTRHTYTALRVTEEAGEKPNRHQEQKHSDQYDLAASPVGMLPCLVHAVSPYWRRPTRTVRVGVPHALRLASQKALCFFRISHIDNCVGGPWESVVAARDVAENP